MRFVVSGHSMEPSFVTGDRLFVSKLVYKFMKPRVGDVIVLNDPRDGRRVLKRILRVAGEKYFVSGDNPAQSTDSRKFGTIPVEAILGKVVRRYGKSTNKDFLT